MESAKELADGLPDINELNRRAYVTAQVMEQGTGSRRSAKLGVVVAGLTGAVNTTGVMTDKTRPKLTASWNIILRCFPLEVVDLVVWVIKNSVKIKELNTEREIVKKMADVSENT
jgi:hypothetical protein